MKDTAIDIDIHAAAPRDAEAAPSGWLRVVRRWWPATIALAFGVTTLLDISPWTPADPTTLLLPVLALVYLVFGAARGRLRRPGVLPLQIAGLLSFGAIALLALFLDPAVGHYVVAAGWFCHAGWDVAHHRDLNHHRSVGVVPRWYAEACFVFDLLIGASLVVAPTL